MRNLGALVLAGGIALLAQQLATAGPLRDPTRPSNLAREIAVPAATGNLNLSAVFISGERRIAIVNGQRLRVGDEILGATVATIEADKVSFLRDGAPLVVPLLRGGTRNRVTGETN